MADYSNTSEMAWLQFSKKIEAYPDLTERDAAALFAQCVELQILKAPATAKFPDLDEMVVNGSNGHYSVSGFVDSQIVTVHLLEVIIHTTLKKTLMGNGNAQTSLWIHLRRSITKCLAIQ